MDRRHLNHRPNLLPASLMAVLLLGCQGSDDGNPHSAGGATATSPRQTGGAGSSSTEDDGTAERGGASADGSTETTNGTGTTETQGGSDQGGSGTRSTGSATGGKSSSATLGQGGSAAGGKSQGGSASGGRSQSTSGHGGTTTSSAPNTSTAPSAVAKEYVDAHNAVRAAVTAPANYSGTWVPLPNVTWSDAVAASAQKWVDHLRDSLNCSLQHESSGTGLGENLAAGTDLTPTQAVQMWAREKSDFTYTKPFSYTASAGHYTQLVWRDSIEIGCASATCNRTVVISCRYKPPGNVIGGQIF